MTPARNITFTLTDLRDRANEPIDVAPGSGHIVKLPIPDQCSEPLSHHDVEFGLLMRWVI